VTNEQKIIKTKLGLPKLAHEVPADLNDRPRSDFSRNSGTSSVCGTPSASMTSLIAGLAVFPATRAVGSPGTVRKTAAFRFSWSTADRCPGSSSAGG
jgi:hypothetical protein